MVDKIAPKLTLKQKAWLSAYLDCFNATEAARRAGYRCRDDQSFGAVGHENFKKLEPRILEWVNRQGFSEAQLKTRIMAGFDAMDTRTAAHEGVITDAKDFIAWEVRRRYLDMACKIMGLYAPDKVDVRQMGAMLNVTPEEALRLVTDPEAHELARRLNAIALGQLGGGVKDD